MIRLLEKPSFNHLYKNKFHARYQNMCLACSIWVDIKLSVSKAGQGSDTLNREKWTDNGSRWIAPLTEAGSFHSNGTGYTNALGGILDEQVSARVGIERLNRSAAFAGVYPKASHLYMKVLSERP